MGVRWVLGLLAALLSCDTSDGRSVNSGKYRVNWDEVTHDVSGRPIEWKSIFYTVYQDSEPVVETTSTFYDGRVHRGCIMLYVTATRTDTEEWQESEPSEVAGICRGE